MKEDVMGHAHDEKYLVLSDAVRFFPGATNTRKLLRLILDGCRGVRLEGWRFGRSWFTTREAIAAFGRDLAKRDLAERDARAQQQAPDRAAEAARRDRAMTACGELGLSSVGDGGTDAAE